MLDVARPTILVRISSVVFFSPLGDGSFVLSLIWRSRNVCICILRLRWERGLVLSFRRDDWALGRYIRILWRTYVIAFSYYSSRRRCCWITILIKCRIVCIVGRIVRLWWVLIDVGRGLCRVLSKPAWWRWEGVGLRVECTA